MTAIEPGLVGESSEVVRPELTAAAHGSGLVAGYATPAMVALMEAAAFTAIRPLLPPGQTTVGIHVDVKHLAATPVGMRVRARAELTRVEGRRLEFKVEAWDEIEKIGEGIHARMIVDEARFNERFEKKRAEAGQA